jgi:hypothetical protein
MSERLQIASEILAALLILDDERVRRGKSGSAKTDNQLCIRALELATKLLKHDSSRRLEEGATEISCKDIPKDVATVINEHFKDLLMGSRESNIELWQRYEKATGNKKPDFAQLWN